MILTVNANAAVDVVMFIDRFVPGSVMRPERVVTSVGGKGLDTAVVLRALSAPVKAVSFVAGKNGETLVKLLEDRQIETDWIWLEGETRLSNVIVETDLNRHSHITTSGYTVTPQDCAVFKQHVQEQAAGAGWAVIAGSLPGGAPATLYGELIHLLNMTGVKVLIDCFGAPARESLASRPEVVKMNQAEFAMTFGAQPGNREAWVRAVRQVMDEHRLQNFVLTSGREGLLAFTPQGVFQAGAPIMQEVNAAGSGEAVSGVIAYRRWAGDGWEEALRWAAAAGAAVTLTEGTAECRPEDVASLLPRTLVEQVA